MIQVIRLTNYSLVVDSDKDEFQIHWHREGMTYDVVTAPLHSFESIISSLHSLCIFSSRKMEELDDRPKSVSE